jgi:hypothetical protein
MQANQLVAALFSNAASCLLKQQQAEGVIYAARWVGRHQLLPCFCHDNFLQDAYCIAQLMVSFLSCLSCH